MVPSPASTRSSTPRRCRGFTGTYLPLGWRWSRSWDAAGGHVTEGARLRRDLLAAPAARDQLPAGGYHCQSGGHLGGERHRLDDPAGTPPSPGEGAGADRYASGAVESERHQVSHPLEAAGILARDGDVDALALEPR